MRSPLRFLTVAVSFAAGAVLLSGCNALQAEIDAMRPDRPSGPNIISLVEAEVPDSTVSIMANKNGFSQDLTVIVSIPDASAITPETAVAGFRATCAVAEKFDFVNYMVAVDTEDRPKVDLAPLLGPTFPEFIESPQLSAYMSMNELCGSD